jgi:hypothetical protein
MLTKLYPLLQRGKTLLSSTLTLEDDLRRFLQDAILVDEEYSKWPTTQAEEWRPRQINFIRGKKYGLMRSPSWWPESIETYYDGKGTLILLYVY